MNLRFAIAAFALATLSGCGGSSGDAPAAAAPTSATAPAMAPDRSTTPQAQGDCDLFSADEVRKAFNGLLSVRRAGGRGERGGGCTFQIAEVNESELVLQAGGQADFDARKQAYSSQSALKKEPLELGREAWLFNGAQVIAVREDGASISLGLLLITFNQPVPVTDEQVRDGLVDLAGLALDRL